MARPTYFNYIEEKLSTLAYRIILRGKLNILEVHLHSETFYQHFLNLLYDWNIENENEFKANIEAIDLIENNKNVVFQVSATCSKEKIESSLDKDLIKKYSNYTFKFISIAKEADDLRKKTYKNPHGIKFDPQDDIIDIKSILTKIKGLDIDKQKQVYEFIQKELGNDTDIVKIDSNLAHVINILAKENWINNGKEDSFNPFDIDRKIAFNEIKYAKKIIDEYKIYYTRVESKYKESDLIGANTSYSVLQLLGRFYVEESLKPHSPDHIFLSIGERVRKTIEESRNFVEIEFEVLVLCIDILLVDAFIRCKIFENPENYNYVTPR